MGARRGFASDVGLDMNRLPGAGGLAVAWLASMLVSGAGLATEPFAYREDFESGELKRWASYPPAQDVAWDPSLLPSPVPALGRFALMRRIRPVQPGPVSFGAIKRIELVVSSGSRVRFSYFIRSYVPPGELRIVLCGSDGVRYAHAIPRPARDEWQHASVPLQRFLDGDRAPADGLSIQAMYWEIDVPEANPANQYSLHLDEIEVEGARRAPPDVVEPQSTERPVSGPWPSQTHPRLYFGEADRRSLLERTRLPGTDAWWKAIEAHARQLRETAGLEAGRDIGALESNPSFAGMYPYLAILRHAGGLIQTNAFVYWLTGDAEAGRAARAALVETTRWKTWTHPWFTQHGQHTYYPVGIFAAGVAFGYDLLYDSLTAEERAQVRRALFEKAIVPAFREYYANDRIPFHTSNWIAHAAGGSLVALLAAAESRDEAEPYLSGLLQKLRSHWRATYLADGSYGEGIDYHEFDLEGSARALAALNNVLGVDLSREYDVAGSHLYPLYALQLPYRQLDFGDTAPRPGVLTPWAWLASHTGDGRAQWYYEQYLKQRAALAAERRPASDVFDFVWYDPRVAPTPPDDLPLSRYFDKKGGVVFRTGWDEDALILNFTAGPFFNHNHLDQGSFQLAGFGETLLAEAGPTEFYADELYQPYFIQSAGHNVVLVDGNPASQRIADHRSDVAALDQYPRIATVLLSDVHDQVRADLRPVYRPALTRFDRTIMFVKPGYFVLFDRLESPGRHRYSQVFHPEFARDLEVAGRQAWIRKPNASLWMNVLAPQDARLEKRAGHIPMSDIARMNAQRLEERAYLEVSATGTGRDAFLVLLFPQPAAAHDRPAVDTIEETDLLGLRVRLGAREDRVGFALRDGARLRVADIDTDARSFRVTRVEGRTTTVSVEEGTWLEAGRQMWLRSDRAVSGAGSVESGRARWTVMVGPEGATVDCYSGERPNAVRVDGRQVTARELTYDGPRRSVRLVLPPGTHAIDFERRRQRK
ncbi:MAG: heparinase II/III family protein [Acidobacteria bacterium]|nr:heparinase II/III family protein [Acidobacteriota bacterium]